MATIVRWDPLQQIERLQHEVERMFSSTGLSLPRTGPVGAWMPETDVEQTEAALVFKLDLPGMAKDDVKVEVHGRTLTISGERKDEREEKHEGYVSRERSVGRFERSMTLPEGAEADKVEASFHNGVLKVIVPRVAEEESRQISITSS